MSMLTTEDEDYVINLLCTATTYCCQLAHYKDLYFIQFPYLSDDEDLDEAFEEVSKIFSDCGIHIKPFNDIYKTKILCKLTHKELQNFVLLNKIKGT